VRLGVDDGQNVEVLEGLRGGELVALNLGTDVADGSPIRPQSEAGSRGSDLAVSWREGGGGGKSR
jgi:hypothetical protein